MIKVGIIGKDGCSRESIKSTLNQESNTCTQFKIVYEAEELLHTHQLDPSSVPEVLVLDAAGQPSGIIRTINTTHPKIIIVVVSKNYTNKSVRNCFQNGALSYLTKKHLETYLPHAIWVSCHGGSFVSPDVCRTLVVANFKVASREEMLTARELQIASGITLGLSYKMIAHNYDISLNTVRVYIKRIYKKLRVNSKSELISQLTI